jgi:hypothetical protein
MSFAAAAGLVVGAGTAIYSGIKQKQQANQIAKNNPYPTQTVPQALLDNQQLAKEQASTGLPSQQYSDAMKNIQRTQENAIRNATSRRAGIGLIGNIQQNTNDATQKLDVANANARLRNIQQLYNVNNRVGQAQQSAFDWNSKNKYLQNYGYSQSLQGAGNANLVHGVDEIGSGLIQGAARGLFGGSYSARVGNPYASTANVGLANQFSGNIPQVGGQIPISPLNIGQLGPAQQYNYTPYINGY